MMNIDLVYVMIDSSYTDGVLDNQSTRGMRFVMRKREPFFCSRGEERER